MTASGRDNGTGESRFVGVWRLQRLFAQDAAGQRTPVWDDNPLGQLIYCSNGEMSAHAYDGRRSPLDGPAESSRAEDVVALFAGSIAYFGRYTIDASAQRITHAVDGAWLPDWIGGNQVRSYRFVDDDHLELSSPGYVLSWQRVAASHTQSSYAHFIKRLELPPGRTAPKQLTHGRLVATAISRAHLQDDVRGINASIQLIAQTRGGGWPVEAVTEEDNYVDLVWHELEFREGLSFTYAVYDTSGEYLGCCYLYPMGRRTVLSADLMDFDVDVSWWVTPQAYARGDYVALFAALRHWMAHEFAGWRPYYSNRVVPDAVDFQASRST